MCTNIYKYVYNATFSLITKVYIFRYIRQVLKDLICKHIEICVQVYTYLYTDERRLNSLIDNTFLKTVEIKFVIMYTHVKEIRFLSFKANDPDLIPSLFQQMWIRLR